MNHPLPTHRRQPLRSVRPLTVSIIIPAYDEQEVIRRCLLAAVDQTVPAREIIVVDNRSTDRTADIVRQVAEEHPRAGIQLVSQHAVQGLVPTRNAGFAAATGDVLGRIDADSVLDRDWVRRQRHQVRPRTAASAREPLPAGRVRPVRRGVVRGTEDHAPGPARQGRRPVGQQRPLGATTGPRSSDVVVTAEWQPVRGWRPVRRQRLLGAGPVGKPMTWS